MASRGRRARARVTARSRTGELHRATPTASRSLLDDARRIPICRRELLARVGHRPGRARPRRAARRPRPAAAAPSARNPLAPKAPHFAPKAKHVIHLFMNGGPSQVDTFDPKPALTKQHGEKPAGRPQDRAQDRRAVQVAVQVPEVRAVRHRGQRDLPRGRQVHRRHLRHPLDAHRTSRTTSRACC